MNKAGEKCHIAPNAARIYRTARRTVWPAASTRLRRRAAEAPPRANRKATLVFQHEFGRAAPRAGVPEKKKQEEHRRWAEAEYERRRAAESSGAKTDERPEQPMQHDTALPDQLVRLMSAASYISVLFILPYILRATTASHASTQNRAWDCSYSARWRT